jgi:hypothetical protein
LNEKSWSASGAIVKMFLKSRTPTFSTPSAATLSQDVSTSWMWLSSTDIVVGFLWRAGRAIHRARGGCDVVGYRMQFSKGPNDIGSRMVVLNFHACFSFFVNRLKLSTCFGICMGKLGQKSLAVVPAPSFLYLSGAL